MVGEVSCDIEIQRSHPKLFISKTIELERMEDVLEIEGIQVTEVCKE